VADSTFGLGGLFPLLGWFLFGAIFLVGVGGVVVIVLLLGLVRVIFVSLVNISMCCGEAGGMTNGVFVCGAGLTVLPY